MFTVETGQKSPFANSYTTVEQADLFHELNNNPDWAVDEGTKQIFLQQASHLIDVLYAKHFVSWKATPDQAMEFPRAPYVDRNGHEIQGITKSLMNATAVLALRLMLEEVSATPESTPQLKSQRTKVGDIETAAEYLKSTPGLYEGYDEVQRHLEPLMKAKTKNKVLTIGL